MLREVEGPIQGPSYLPEQFYLASKLDGWHHISYEYNHEVGIDPRWDAQNCQHVLNDTKVWHYSGKNCMQPWMFLDFTNSDLVEEWIERHYGSLDHLDRVFSTSFSEWHTALHELLLGPENIRQFTVVFDSLERLRSRSDYERCQQRACQQSRTDATFEGRRRPREYFDATVAFPFPEFVTYQRVFFHTQPGPDGDEAAFVEAISQWNKAIQHEEDAVVYTLCSQCGNRESCYPGNNEFATEQYCNACWTEWEWLLWAMAETSFNI